MESALTGPLNQNKIFQWDNFAAQTNTPKWQKQELMKFLLGECTQNAVGPLFLGRFQVWLSDAIHIPHYISATVNSQLTTSQLYSNKFIVKVRPVSRFSLMALYNTPSKNKKARPHQLCVDRSLTDEVLIHRTAAVFKFQKAIDYELISAISRTLESVTMLGLEINWHQSDAFHTTHWKVNNWQQLLLDVVFSKVSCSKHLLHNEPLVAIFFLSRLNWIVMSNPQDKCAIVCTVGFALLLCKQSIIFYLPATIDAGSLRSDSAVCPSNRCATTLFRIHQLE